MWAAERCSIKVKQSARLSSAHFSYARITQIWVWLGFFFFLFPFCSKHCVFNDTNKCARERAKTAQVSVFTVRTWSTKLNHIHKCRKQIFATRKQMRLQHDVPGLLSWFRSCSPWLVSQLKGDLSQKQSTSPPVRQDSCCFEYRVLFSTPLA